MAEELDGASNPEATQKDKEAKEVKPTLEDLAKQNKDLNEKVSQIIKQNSDKDSHISKIETENAELRSTLQKVTTSITGKTEKQKDSILEREKQKLVDRGFDPVAVDSLLETVVEIANQQANQRIVPLIMEASQDLIESDPEIDKDLLEKNSQAITDEYNTYKVEVSPRKIKANLKKAYKIIKERLAETAKKEGKESEEDKRNNMLAGGSPPPKGSKKDEGKDDLLDRIEASGSKHGHFV